MVSDSKPATIGPGAMLRTAREARDLTQQDVCDTLNLLVRVVEDIENDNYARLPPAAFTRGYLRSYAKLLDVDSQRIVTAFDEAIADTPVTASTQPLNGVPKKIGSVGELMQKQPGTVLTGAVALVICSVLIVLWAVWPDDSTTSASNALPPFPQGSAAPSAPGAEIPARGAAAGSELAPVATATPADATPAVAADAAADRVALPAQPPTEAGAPLRITATGEDQLAFSFADDCWVEVKDKQGRGIYSDLSHAGDSLALIGQAPFVIVLGNAPGVTLAFNGERVTLSPHTRNNIATLALGQ